MSVVKSVSSLAPFSLRDAPYLIERVWPAQKISVEAQKERKAGAGQTLTALGSYWKGRKPLVLVRACVIASLLPATDNAEKDLEIFEILLGMGDVQIPKRFKKSLSVEDIVMFGSEALQSALLEKIGDDLCVKRLPKIEKIRLMTDVIKRMPYLDRVECLLRPEEVPEADLTGEFFNKVNEHVGTNAHSMPELIEQLGVARFGHRPKVADTFSGGGSIPFESARLGCDVYASDLNPIACMLTWGAVNVIGASSDRRENIERSQTTILAAIDAEIRSLGIEIDENCNQAKAYLYCLEARCPHTGWMVPLAPSWIISKQQNAIAILIPNHANKRFDIQIKSGVTQKELAAAARGTILNGSLTYRLGDETFATPIKTIRGDYRDINGQIRNRIRQWEKSDFSPRPDDVFQERLYCIQWIDSATVGKSRQKTFFSSVTPEDIVREQMVDAIVRQNLSTWQNKGLVPDMPIEPGEKTDEPIRTRGWTYWHHLYTARQILYFSLILRHKSECNSISLARLLDRSTKINSWIPSATRDAPANVFANQALNTFYSYGSYASYNMNRLYRLIDADGLVAEIDATCIVSNHHAGQIATVCDLFITDPPYADAVVYHEITEFFIAWLRKNPPQAFKDWTWDSRRPLAIKGNGDAFRKGMIAAYKAMADHMPDNGLQIVMFTHQDAGVWGDMAQIFWGAGLQVVAAWYIATETTSELKKGGYVQGTVIIVLRKRKDGESGYKNEIVQEVKFEVAEQMDTMSGLNQSLKGHGRIENLFEDADLQMAGYAAALRVLTKYTTIDGVDMTKEAVRSRVKGEKGIVGEIIDFAVQIANEHMVPEGMASEVWRALNGSERFFYKMLDIEETGANKLDNYQNFSRAFRVPKYDDLMGSMEPNKARLKTAKEFQRSGFESEFGLSKSRALMFALHELQNDIEGDVVLSHLHDMVSDYFNVRDHLVLLAEYVSKKRSKIDEHESRAAAILQGLIRNERFG